MLFQFKEISFAYEVLTNPEKKELYDRYGEQGLREGGGGGPGMDDIFSHIFGGGLFGFMGGQGRGRNGGRRRGEDMVHPLKYVFCLGTVRMCQQVAQIECVILSFFFFPHTEYLLKTSTMEKPPNYSSVRMFFVVPVMGKFSYKKAY